MKIDVNLKSGTSYSIDIEEMKNITLKRKVVIVTNETIAPLHLEELKSKIDATSLSVVILKDGEEYKNQQSIDMILEHCFEQKLNRKSLLIAFGGGVIGDMTGFAASIYQRGIEFIQIPTTLLSQVDASVGGKTGINCKYGKNLIGAFHQPSNVKIDINYLKTLPRREYNAGIAEIIKVAATLDKDFFNWLESHDLYDEKNIQMAILKAVQIKADVVMEDEKELGIRACLNYGHTFAHVIEKETNYKIYLHGEAVGIGMVMANDLAQRLGNITKDEAKAVENLLEKYNIPTKYEIEDINSFYEDFYLDKKSSDSSLKFIILNKIGNHEITEDIEKSEIIQTLKVFEK